MTTVQVTVEVQVNNLTDEAARELARSLVESKGLTVARVGIKAQPDRVKVWQPKAGAPGSTVVRGGRSFQVWASAPEKGSLWLIPTEQQDGDAPVYKCYGHSDTPIPHHSDGSRCQPTTVYRDEHGEWLREHRTEPCGHQSHNRVSKAA